MNNEYFVIDKSYDPLEYKVVFITSFYRTMT